MSKLNLNDFPPGGWQFYEPDTGWRVQNPLQHDFFHTAKMIAGHRKANRALAHKASLAQAEADLIAYTRSRLRLDQPAPDPGHVAPQKKSGCGTCGSR